MTMNNSESSLNRLTVFETHNQRSRSLDLNIQSSMNISDTIFYEDDQVLIHGKVLDVKRIFVRKISTFDASEIVIGKLNFNTNHMNLCKISCLTNYYMMTFA